MTTSSPRERADLREKAEAAHQEVVRICKGGRWIMSIPARPGYDSDLLIDDALNALIEHVEALEAQVEGVRALAKLLESEPPGDIDRHYAARRIREIMGEAAECAVAARIALAPQPAATEEGRDHG